MHLGTGPALSLPSQSLSLIEEETPLHITPPVTNCTMKALLAATRCGSRVWETSPGVKEGFHRGVTFKLSVNDGWRFRQGKNRKPGRGHSLGKGLEEERVLAWSLVQRKRPFINVVDQMNEVLSSQCISRMFT